jgi:hypothetical protein
MRKLLLMLVGLLAVVPVALALPPESVVDDRMVIDEVTEGLRRYRAAKHPGERARLLAKLGKQDDVRLTLELGDALADEAKEVRGVAIQALARRYFPKVKDSLEQEVNVLLWWLCNEDDLRRRADELP